MASGKENHKSAHKGARLIQTKRPKQPKPPRQPPCYFPQDDAVKKAGNEEELQAYQESVTAWQRFWTVQWFRAKKEPSNLSTANYEWLISECCRISQMILARRQELGRPLIDVD
ncbi:hypothetical protein K461DRAFT_272143 [Myriangium duriaei CBS 260.36]|uniref:Uncharacterized protein n=1 Tax=Myriangium duriaei CBS 260.36 TaxID=1168546 RepID=A0A9P4IPY8_9PEZI|nr:hypothetical protein K461DRAFT_272143 [Myriangium duriaei CBS 260.36]